MDAYFLSLFTAWPLEPGRVILGLDIETNVDLINLLPKERNSFTRKNGLETIDESLEISWLIVQHLISLGENLEVQFPREDN